jgi:ABC-type Zn uptake system ZnuABC Zn-binding protein ZnuA
VKKVGLTASLLISAVLLTLAIFLPGCSRGEASNNLTVVTTTSLISSIVERVGGDKVEVADIIPPAQCPGHFDVKPSDIQMLANANLFLMHGWQGEQFSQQLIQSANNPGLKAVSLNIQGNWMTPAVQAQALGNITSILAEIDPQNASYYQSNANSELAAITTKNSELETRLAAANLGQINVICDSQVTDLVQWAGFNVVASYPSPDTITPKMLQDLIDQGKQAGVALIIGNLQSGSSDMAVTMADGIGAVQITLSNFPGGFDNTETWEKAIDEDANLMLQAAATCRGNSN